MRYSKTFLVLLLDNHTIDLSQVAPHIMGGDLGIELIYAFSIEEAEQIVKKRELHLTLLNVDVPGTKEKTALEAMLFIAPTVPVVVITKSSSPEEALRFVTYGAIDCVNVERLQEPRALVRIILFAIERGRMFQDLIAREAHQREIANSLHNELAEIKAIISLPLELDSVAKLKELTEKIESITME